MGKKSQEKAETSRPYPEHPFEMAIIDADSIVYAAGFACEKWIWKVYPAGVDIHDEDTPSLSEFTGKKKLNAFLKKEGFDPAIMHPVNNKNGDLIQLSNEKFTCTAQLQLESESSCLHTVKQMFNGILDGTGAKECAIYLTKGAGFRGKIFPEYKMNRDKHKPVYYDLIREYMIRVWGARVDDELEADDSVAMDTTSLQEDLHEDAVVLCSIDKDLNQVWGWHYNYNLAVVVGARPLYYVTPEEARLSFFQQVLTGDTADNIFGIPRVGEATALKMLGHCHTVEDYMAVVTAAYEAENARRDKEKIPPLNLELNLDLLFMRRKSINDDWRAFI